MKNNRTLVQIFLGTPGSGSKVEMRICLSSPYNKEAIIELKKIPGHMWHRDEKYWHFPLAKAALEKLLQIFKDKKVAEVLKNFNLL